MGRGVERGDEKAIFSHRRPSISSIQLHPHRDGVEGGSKAGGVILGCCWWRELIKSNVFHPLLTESTFSYTLTHTHTHTHTHTSQSKAPLHILPLFLLALSLFSLLHPPTCSRRFDYSAIDHPAEMKAQNPNIINTATLHHF